jgi:hypothetical protein
MGTRITALRFAAIAVLLLCAVAMQARAATITVTTTNDSGPGSLRQALTIANDGDTINFAVTGRIILISGGLVIDKNVSISGPGADRLSVDGNQTPLQCVLYTALGKTVTISGLTITNGDAGICNDHGALTVRNCVVTGNSSYGGIGVNGSHGPGVERGNNRRDAQKIYGDRVLAGISLTIDNSIVSDNLGQGVFNDSATVTILNSSISGNSAGQFGDGGGIYASGFKGPPFTTVINSTISGNSASDAGGGIVNENGGLSILNSTISGNSAGYNGGGIANYSGGIEIANSTLSGNSAGSGGGIYNSAGQFGGRLEIGDTIFNAGASGENIFNNGGTVTSHGYNISSDNGGGYLNGPGDQINTDPLLGPLQDNGGPTLTHAPLPGSPAIDAGDPNFTPPPSRDQRGRCFYRVFGRRIDIGSVEIQPQPRCPTPAPRPTPR